MTKLRVLAACAALMCVSTASADVSIDELIQQADLSEGPVAVRDLPNWQGAKKILVARVSASDLDDLRQLHPEVEFIAVSRELGRQDTENAKDADAIVGVCDAGLIEAAPRLVWTQIPWAGAEDCLTVPRIASGDVVLTNMQKMSAPVIGEHAVALALALARGLPRFAKAMQGGERTELYAAPRSMMPLSGKTMLVVGLGGIGTEAARRAAALGMRVIGTRNSSREGPEFIDYVGLGDELIDLAGQADVIVNALPLTDSTRGLLGKEFFDATRKGALYVNVGRGATTDTDALVAALTSGQIGGAGLDVTEPEPLPIDHPLWEFDNVLITPHVAGFGGEHERHLALLRENLRRYVAGERLLNVVDPDLGY